MAMALTIQPLGEAIAKLSAKTPIGAALNSAEWADVPLALRERAQFSANIESVRLLSTIQDKLSKRVGLIQEQVANGDAFVDRSSFIGDIRQMAIDLGVRTTDEDGAGTVRDIHSAKRLGMIFDIQTQQAAEFARWKMDQDPDVLDAYPAQRLIRVESRQAPRDWEARWSEAGGAVGWKEALQTPQVALKSSPIWAELSAFGTPWPPFDFGSGMGVEDVDRAEAEQLELLKPADQVRPAEVDFNRDLQASVANLEPEDRQTLQAQFGDQVRLYGDTAKWVPKAMEDYIRKSVGEPQWKPNGFSIGVASVDAAAECAGWVDLSGCQLRLEADRARHIWDTHGPGSPATPDSIPMRPVDFRAIPLAWRLPDLATHGGQEDTVMLWKRNPDDTWLRLVVAKTGPKSATVVSANVRAGKPSGDSTKVR